MLLWEETMRRTANSARHIKKSPTPIERPAGTSSGPTEDEIAMRAYELFIASGSQTGRDTEFWLEAERQLSEDGARSQT